MSKFWEKVFYILSYLSQGYSAFSPNVYGKMHRIHHAYTDTEKDLHSPRQDKEFSQFQAYLIDNQQSYQ